MTKDEMLELVKKLKELRDQLVEARARQWTKQHTL
jgi:hypothetical protein